MYILSTGCQWRYIPKDFPPRSTLHDYFTWWICDGTLNRIHHALYVECREKMEREASPTACIIDSQSVKSAEKDAMGRGEEIASIVADVNRWSPQCKRRTT
jgi:transposase